MQPLSHRQPRRQRRSSRAIRGYEIRVAGHLEDATLDSDLSIRNQANGDALLSGSIPDQSALLRVLLRLHEMGMTIVSVKAVKRNENREA